MLLLGSLLLLGIGLWVAWTGFKACEQVYGITLLFTGVILVMWSLTLAPLWFQITVECVLITLSHFLSRSYMDWRKNKVLIPVTRVRGWTSRYANVSRRSQA